MSAVLLFNITVKSKLKFLRLTFTRKKASKTSSDMKDQKKKKGCDNIFTLTVSVKLAAATGMLRAKLNL